MGGVRAETHLHSRIPILYSINKFTFQANTPLSTLSLSLLGISSLVSYTGSHNSVFL